ncbi:MAG: hypothetical protein QNJ46_30260 [Leptolyngbyaceae cyanobacterium MO_188.B28]|nr:hypothetical protein [Leptolyngbyaceae cyanobacterium MO_188.B28]
MTKFIVYACPLGELADQINTYFEKSLFFCNANAAHNYMPHCTLTGFFEEETCSIPLYTQTLKRSLNRLLQTCPDPVIDITDMVFRADWHGLELQSPWLKKVMIDFVATALSPTRHEPIRLKQQLHLSLAYEFQTKHRETLIQLAQKEINPQAAVKWELRFYQRHPDNSWTCHLAWPLGCESLMGN